MVKAYLLRPCLLLSLIDRFRRHLSRKEMSVGLPWLRRAQFPEHGLAYTARTALDRTVQSWSDQY
jgi:hypothetical protein